MNQLSRLDRLVAHSVELIVAHQSGTGAYLASPTFPTYRYSWFRDGAFIADAMSRYDHVASADAFHRWASGIVSDRREQIAELVRRGRAGEPVAPDEHLHTRYTVDGAEAGGFWENFQLDGYGTWLWALHAHQHRHRGGEAAYETDLAATVDYLATFWSAASYDWWEEHLEHRHTSTLVAIWAGLDAVARWEAIDDAVRERAGSAAARIRHLVLSEGVVDGSLVKWLGSGQVDASLVACLTPFDFLSVDDPVALATVARVDAELAPAGVYRYLADVYYGGGEWVLLAGFLAWHHARCGRTERARELVSWMLDQADDAGDLPEQTAERMLHPEHLPAWEERWGPSARPLLWSHAMLLSVASELPIDVEDLT